MLASSVSTPYDLPLFVLLIVLAVILLVGVISAPGWPPFAAMLTRRGAAGAGVAATLAVLVRTPTRDPFVSLGRMVSIWPALVVVLLLYAAWSWRAGRW